jgi:hypothetical protein
MRILSPFRDYYDSVQAQGQDRDILFLRKASLAAVALPGMPWDACLLDKKGLTQTPSGPLKLRVHFKGVSHLHFPGHPVNDLSLQRAYVLVGGRAHAVWVHADYVEEAAHDNSQRQGQSADEWALGEPAWLGDPDSEHMVAAWRAEQIKADPALAERKMMARMGHGDELDYAEFLGDPDPERHLWEMREHERVHEAVLTHDWTALHVDQGTPLLLIKALSRQSCFAPRDDRRSKPTTWLVRNPRLSDVRLGSVIDAFTLFQEVSLFIGGVMPGRTAPVLTISDKVQVIKKGFDPIYGFRRRPEKAA